MEVSIAKTFRIVPKGINLVIGCSTFPVWNTVPGMFAGLATGNAVIVKPHPGAVYPIAIVVAVLQQTLQSLGLDPHVCQLAVDTVEHPITLDLVRHPSVRVIDYTGGPHFGDIVEREGAAHGKTVFTEKAGVNCVILDSANDLDKALENVAFSLSLYGGQMCTAPQNIFIARDGMLVGGERVGVEDVAIKLREKIDALVLNEKMGPGTVGRSKGAWSAGVARQCTDPATGLRQGPERVAARAACRCFSRRHLRTRVVRTDQLCDHGRQLRRSRGPGGQERAHAWCTDHVGLLHGRCQSAQGRGRHHRRRCAGGL
jgi:hypothetical protein